MATVQPPPRTVQRPAGTVRPPERVVIHGVSWRTYESLLDDFPDCQAPRFAYDRGTLEIVVTISSEHEETKRTIELLVDLIAGGLGTDIRRVGGMTVRREDVQQGFEPDSSYYIQRAALVRGRRIDPAVDPPPDLIIEIDVTSDSFRKFPLFAGLGIPEVWRFDGERITIHALRAGTYEESSASLALPVLSSEALNRFLEDSRTLPPSDWLLSVLAWAQQLDRTERPSS